MPVSTSICDPVDPFKPELPLHKKIFVDDGYSLELSYLSLPKDVLVVLDWLSPRPPNKVWKNINPKNELSQMYRESLESTFTQSFMIWKLGKPKPVALAQFDINRLYGRNTFDHWIPRPGDFSLRILVSPHIMRFENALLNILKIFSEYVVHFPEVRRLITTVDEGYYKAADVLAYAGWESGNKIQLPEHRVIIYGISRETLIDKYGNADMLDKYRK